MSKLEYGEQKDEKLHEIREDHRVVENGTDCCSMEKESARPWTI